MFFSREEVEQLFFSAALAAPDDAASAAVPRELLIQIALVSPGAWAAITQVWKWLARVNGLPFVRTVVAYYFDCPSHLTLLERTPVVGNTVETLSVEDLAHRFQLQSFRMAARNLAGYWVSPFAGKQHRRQMEPKRVFASQVIDVTINPDEEQPFPILCVSQDLEVLLAYGGGLVRLFHPPAERTFDDDDEFDMSIDSRWLYRDNMNLPACIVGRGGRQRLLDLPQTVSTSEDNLLIAASRVAREAVLPANLIPFTDATRKLGNLTNVNTIDVSLDDLSPAESTRQWDIRCRPSLAWVGTVYASTCFARFRELMQPSDTRIVHCSP